MALSQWNDFVDRRTLHLSSERRTLLLFFNVWLLNLCKRIFVWSLIVERDELFEVKDVLCCCLCIRVKVEVGQSASFHWTICFVNCAVKMSLQWRKWSREGASSVPLGNDDSEVQKKTLPREKKWRSVTPGAGRFYLLFVLLHCQRRKNFAELKMFWSMFEGTVCEDLLLLILLGTDRKQQWKIELTRPLFSSTSRQFTLIGQIRVHLAERRNSIWPGKWQWKITRKDEMCEDRPLNKFAFRAELQMFACEGTMEFTS